MQNAEITNNDVVANLGPLRGQCCAKPGNRVRGSYFLGGAGLNGLYIPKLIQALHKAGIKSAIYLDREKWSSGQYADAAIGVTFGREYDSRFPMLLRVRPNVHKQFNLIGYSYGSLIAAQLAIKYAKKGTVVDHLVLIGSPISKAFLMQLKNSANIKKTIVVDLNHHGDPIYAGMVMSDLAANVITLIGQMPRSEGHFYYAKEGAVGDKRRKELAIYLYGLGLR